ncbi:MAG: type II toxin-antitoxin system HicB family antitoxin [Planctomycetales bacterium]|nr:type II toxin-antitoxin system HicB family antitoxin [Planctomycetales bacterium]
MPSDNSAAAPRYDVILYSSEPDRAYIAEVPELADCAADGATYQEALAAIEIVITQRIETANELGRPIPVPRGRLLFA